MIASADAKRAPKINTPRKVAATARRIDQMLRRLLTTPRVRPRRGRPRAAASTHDIADTSSPNKVRALVKADMKRGTARIKPRTGRPGSARTVRRAAPTRQSAQTASAHGERQARDTTNAREPPRASTSVAAMPMPLVQGRTIAAPTPSSAAAERIPTCGRESRSGQKAPQKSPAGRDGGTGGVTGTAGTTGGCEGLGTWGERDWVGIVFSWVCRVVAWASDTRGSMGVSITRAVRVMDGAMDGAMGRRTRRCAPSVLSGASIRPPWSSQIQRAMASPRPEPPVEVSAEPKRWKSRSRCAAGIPGPWSRTSRTQWSPSCCALNRTVPPAGLCRSALSTRLMTT